MLGMYGPCLRRHPHFESVRCVDVAGHSGAHMAHTPGGVELSWTDAEDGLRALAAREAGADLDATKDHLAALRARGDLAGALTATTAELHRLIAEVEYLREENTKLRIMLDRRLAEVSLLQQEARIRKNLCDGLVDEVGAERAVVVAYLYKESELLTELNTPLGFRLAVCLSEMAEAIERGEHRREEE